MAQLKDTAEATKQRGGAQFRLTEWIETAPFEDLLSMTIETARAGEAMLSMPFQVKHANGGGVMHGGALVALADTAVAMAIKSLLDEGTRFATTQLQMNFLAPVEEGRVFARAKVTGPEGRSFEGQADLCDEQDLLLARFTCRFRIARGHGFFDPGEEDAGNEH